MSGTDLSEVRLTQRAIASVRLAKSALVSNEYGGPWRCPIFLGRAAPPVGELRPLKANW